MNREAAVLIYVNVLKIWISVTSPLEQCLTKTVLGSTKYMSKAFFASRIAVHD